MFFILNIVCFPYYIVRQLSCQEVQMHISVFGAAGPTGLWVCREARKAGHTVTAVSRRTDPLPLPDDPSLNTVCADAVTGTGVAEAVAGSDAVISSLGSAYSRRPISVYSEGNPTHRRRHAEQRAQQPAHRCQCRTDVSASAHELVRRSSGLPSSTRSHRENSLRRHAGDGGVSPDGPRHRLDRGPTRKLINDDAVSDFRLEPGNPTRGFTSRPDLAAAMVSLLPGNEYSRSVVAPTTDVRRRKR